jgi:hypothetical protein
VSQSVRGAVVAQYKKTLVGTQIAIGLVTLAVLVRGHSLGAALTFFGTMQLGAWAGAAWGVALRARAQHG